MEHWDFIDPLVGLSPHLMCLIARTTEATFGTQQQLATELFAEVERLHQSVRGVPPLDAARIWAIAETYRLGALLYIQCRLEGLPATSEEIQDLKLDLHGYILALPTSGPSFTGHMNAILNNCDKDDVNNPHDYKFGSTITTSAGWNFKMTPLSKQVNELSCDVSYKFVFDGFEIRGKIWPDAKLGANGEGLKGQVSGCGALTNWHFEWTPQDVKYQFYASGQLPIGTKPCVGSAVQSAGGADAGGCKGAGRHD